jgi:hypothetical protein
MIKIVHLRNEDAWALSSQTQKNIRTSIAQTNSTNIRDDLHKGYNIP